MLNHDPLRRGILDSIKAQRALGHNAPAEALDNLTGHNTFAGSQLFSIATAA
jgi:hypothetical protein